MESVEKDRIINEKETRTISREKMIENIGK